jgi:hypothetical protein
MAVLAYGPLPLLGVWWTTMVIFLAAMVLELLPRPWSFAAFGAVVLVESPVALIFGDSLQEAVYTSLRVITICRC